MLDYCPLGGHFAATAMVLPSIGVIGAIIANASGTGGGVVFVLYPQRDA